MVKINLNLPKFSPNILSYFLSYNFDELASSGYILFPSCGIMDEIV